jgi:hypothetical protein
VRDGLLIPLPEHAPNSANLGTFIIPKNATKASFIADLRFLNYLSSPAPKFQLPTFLELAQLIQTHPPGAMWATSLDISNFFWSLKLPTSCQDLFRLPPYAFPCLPFGWNLSPILAQTTLSMLVQEAIAQSHFPLCLYQNFWYFLYYDDILLLTLSPTTATLAVLFFSTYLSSKGLIISPKSEVTPTQTITWLGKEIDLSSRCIRNKPSTILRALATVILFSFIPIYPKAIDVLTGYCLWFFRPHRGSTLLLRSWYLTKLARRRINHSFPSMMRPLFHLFLIGLNPWFARDPIPPPFFTPIICTDAAIVHDFAQIGIYSPILGGRIFRKQLPYPSQQFAELLAMEIAIKLAQRLGWTATTIIGDNQGTLYLMKSFSAPIGNSFMCTTLRRILNNLRHTPITAHLIWCPSHIQPADPLTRLQELSAPTPDAAQEVMDRWTTLSSNFAICKNMGILHI